MPVVIIDNGTGFCKAGLSGDDPVSVVPSVVGHRKDDSKDTFVGEDALKKRSVLDLKYPIHNGIITNWDDMETLWTHIFRHELRVDTRGHPVLLTEAPLNPQSHREKMAQIMFETYQVPSLFIALQPVLSLFASGRMIGTALVSGDGLTYSLPIINSVAKLDALTSLDITGKDLTAYFSTLVQEKGYSFKLPFEEELLREAKEKLCYVVPAYIKAISSAAEEKTHQFVDLRTITLGAERFQCPEALFRPVLLNKETAGVAEMTMTSIMKCEQSVRSQLFGNIVPSGGNTLYPGFGERVTKDLEKAAPKGTKIKVVAPFNGEHSVWYGGSLLSSHSNFKDISIGKQEYEEIGPSIVAKKCGGVS